LKGGKRDRDHVSTEGSDTNDAGGQGNYKKERGGDLKASMISRGKSGVRRKGKGHFIWTTQNRKIRPWIFEAKARKNKKRQLSQRGRGLSRYSSRVKRNENSRAISGKEGKTRSPKKKKTEDLITGSRERTQERPSLLLRNETPRMRWPAHARG